MKSGKPKDSKSDCDILEKLWERIKPKEIIKTAVIHESKIAATGYSDPNPGIINIIIPVITLYIIGLVVVRLRS